MVADRVRIIGAAATPPPPVGGDPEGLVQSWLDRAETVVVNAMITNPQDPANGLAFHLDYDGLWTCWCLSKLLSAQNPTAAQAVFDYGEQLLETVWNYAGMSLGPTQAGEGAQGWRNYNLGPLMYGLDPATTPPGGLDAVQMSCNFARFSGYARPTWPLYYLVNGDNTWPSPTTRDNPAVPPNLNREFARGINTHVATDAFYDDHDDLIYPNGDEYLVGHNMYIHRVVGHWFLGQDVDLQGGQGAIDQWRGIFADLAAAGGDFTQVPDTWLDSGYEFTPWAWTHTFWGLMAYYEDTRFTGEPHDSYKALIVAAIKDLADASMSYFSKLSTSGLYTGLMYRIPVGGDTSGTLANADLALWEMPVFAWLYAKTGNLTYYNFAVELIKFGIAGAWLPWQKQFNQFTYGAWSGFQWLGWTDQPTYKLPWKYDLVGGETWP